jgi:hypothetical protein
VSHLKAEEGGIGPRVRRGWASAAPTLSLAATGVVAASGSIQMDHHEIQQVAVVWHKHPPQLIRQSIHQFEEHNLTFRPRGPCTHASRFQPIGQL